MKRDWGTWVSMVLIAGVCAVIALGALPSEPPGPEPAPQAQPQHAPAAVKADSKKSKTKGYRVNAPDRSIELADDVQEISGLSAANDGKSLWAVDDERAKLFRLATTNGAIVDQIDLRERGDYESVEEIGDRVWVARSDGTLLIVDPKGAAPVEKLTLLTELGLACEVEGLAHEPKKHRLLISCKNEGMKTRRSNKAFEIYALDLETKKVGAEPAFVLEESEIDAHLASHAEEPGLQRLRGQSFAPSGLAVHPKTGELYILSTRGKMLIALAPDGSLLDVGALDPQLHLQPEGIAFGADGTLYISNEAHGPRPARLLVYGERR